MMVGVSTTSPIFGWLADELNCSWENCDSAADLLATVAELPPHLILAGDALKPAELTKLFHVLRAVERTRKLPAGLIVHDPARRDQYVQVLTAGADELIVCSTADDPLVRLGALVRRSRPSSGDQILVHGDIRIDLRGHRAFRGNRMLDLTRRPFQLVCLLVSNPGKLFSHQRLMETLWGGETADERAVRACVLRLRWAMNAGGEPEAIQTIRGLGYSLIPQNNRPRNKSAT